MSELSDNLESEMEVGDSSSSSASGKSFDIFHKSRKQENAFSLLLDGRHSDLKIYVGIWPESKGPVDKKQLFCIPVHKCVIAGASPAFEKMFTGELENRSEVIITDIEPLAFFRLIQ